METGLSAPSEVGMKSQTTFLLPLAVSQFVCQMQLLDLKAQLGCHAAGCQLVVGLYRFAK
jgi:hypothetical protein